ncbi:MAG: Ig-like domain-containing protein [Candidatus Zipacnadales bacterium]
MRQPRSVGSSVPLVVAILCTIFTIAAYAAPLVSIDKPRDKAIITGIADIYVSYAADSASPIERVQVYIDGELAKDYRLEKPQLQGNVQFRWDFTAVTPSRHSISARAQDASGAVGTTGIKVEVRRTTGAEPAMTDVVDRTPPTVDIYYPEEGAVVTGEIQVKADVSDNVGVRTVIFYLDGGFRKMIMNSANYQDRIDTTKLSDGPHVVQASAWDAADNEGRSAERTFIVRNREATPAQGRADSVARKVGDTTVPAPVPEIPKPPVPALVTPASGSTPVTDAQLAIAPIVSQPLRGDVGRPSTDVSVPDLPPPSSIAKPDDVAGFKTPPRTSGMTASLPAEIKSTTNVALASPQVPSTAEAPRTDNIRQLPNIPLRGSPNLVQLAAVAAESSARTLAPPDAVVRPKTTEIMGQPTFVIAEPTRPASGYESEPLGGLRQERLAMLPRRSDEVVRSRKPVQGDIKEAEITR